MAHMIPENIKIGTSGFSYKDWKGNFYPESCPDNGRLKHYVTRFNTVEIDSTYYRVPAISTVQKWAKTTPEDFIFTAKFPRTVTHEGDIEQRVDNARHFVEVMSEMGEKIGALLLQFPYSFKPDKFSMLEELVSELPDKIRISVELRNKMWLKDPLFDLLRRHKMALCLVDHPWVPRFTVKTADFHYIRLLGDRKKVQSDFSHIQVDREEQLNWWRDVISDFSSDGGPIYAFVNNHYSGHSPTTASQLIELLDNK